jgi:protein-disulfide isomerase
MSTWVIIKPYLLQINQMQPLKQQLGRFKFNTGLFTKMLNNETVYPLPAAADSLIIGNCDAEHIITMASNPYCQPCSKVHSALSEWLGNRNDIKLQLVFPTPDNEKDIRSRVASHFMTLQAQNNDTSLKNAIDDWYNQKHKNYESWTKRYPVSKQTTNIAALQKQREWCKLVEIKGTPTIFINGRRLPEPYQPEDIKYFI